MFYAARSGGKVLVLAWLLLTLAGCAGHMTRGDEYARKDEWSKAILEYRQAYADNPDDIEVKSRLKQMELKAADYYYHRGLIALENGDVDRAIAFFQQGLVAMPENEKLQAAMRDAQARKDAAAVYDEGMNLLAAGKRDEAKQRFQRALDLYPDEKQAALRLAEIEKQEAGASSEGLALTSSAPITLNFRDTDIRDAYEFLTKSFGVNVVFDDGVKNVPVTLYAKDVTFKQGLDLLLATSKTFYRKIGPNSILLAMDSKEKRGQYEDEVMRTFSLNTIRAKDMADILKGLMTIKKIVINEELNTITIRDTDDVLRLAERTIEVHDRKPAEVLLDVEILEIDRTKAETLGLDFGSYQISASIPPYPLTQSFSAARSSGLLTLPTATLNFFKQDVDAKTLANPRLRVLSGRSAKIHIGDRVPLIATTIQDATGQVRNTFDYKDIGIGLDAAPIVHLDNSVTVKLGLVVSTLGQNLGTPSQPAYSIGSRDAETYMLLRDGETAILGGLIQDSDRNNKVFIPGLGEIPAVGSLFTNYNNSAGRTDVLLTITPHVVRGWEQPSPSERRFFSGTENTYADHQLFAELTTRAVSDAGQPVTPRIDTNGVTSGSPTATPPAGTTPPPAPAQPAVLVAPTAPASAAAPPPQLGFSDAVYEATAGSDLSIKLTGQNLAGVTALPIEVLYNAQVMSFVRADAGSPVPQSFNAAADESKGVISLKVAYAAGAAAQNESVIASITMHANKAGVSYLMYRSRTVTGANGAALDAQVRASRVVVK
jgi:general secretion pathway protein D